MLEILEQQRAALFAELPVPPAIRQDRLRRFASMIEENSGALCAALCRDDSNQSQASAMRTMIAPARAILGNALRNVEKWMRPAYRGNLWGRLVGRGGYIEYQPIGVVGFATSATHAIEESLSLLASILAAGNRVMVRFGTPRLGRLLAQLAPRYFSAIEFHVVDAEAEDAGAFATLPFDLLVTGDPADTTPNQANKSAVIIGRSADFATAAEQIIASKLAQSIPKPFAPDYLLVPAEQEEAIASWLWRAAMRLPSRMVDQLAGLPLSDAEIARFNRLIDNARARGAEILVAERPGDTVRAGVQHMPLHIVRHATDDMRVMQEAICGPILPLRGYGDIDEAIGEIQRHAAPLVIYHFGHDVAERSHILAHTLSASIVFDGGSLAMPPSGPGLAHGNGDGAAAFRRFSRARNVCLPPLFDLGRHIGIRRLRPA